MNEIWNILLKYEGSGFMVLLYFISLVFLFLREDDSANRKIFLYTPLVFVILFFLPPFYRLYGIIDGTDTYYRILWMAPMAVTIGYCVVRQFSGHLRVMVMVSCALIAVAGNYVYNNENILRVENRLHLPQLVLDICDVIMTDTGGEQAMAAMPPNVVQFVRQYDTRILMPYGREMLMPQWSSYYHAVYDAYVQDPIDAEYLVESIRDYDCDYVVLEEAKAAGLDLESFGLDLLRAVDGFVIYKDTTKQGQGTSWGF